MQFTLDPKPTKDTQVDQHHNQRSSDLDRRHLLKLGIASVVATSLPGPSTKGTIPGGILRTSDPGESWAFQWRVMPVSDSLARQERQSQPKPGTER